MYHSTGGPVGGRPVSGLQVVLVVHAVTTIAMAGLIWFVQIVHYPLFARVGTAEFDGYHEAHMARTGRVVVPLMLGELAAAGGLLVIAPPGLRALASWGLGVLALIWLSTFVLQVPIHRRLAAEPSTRERDVRALARTNWLRTAGWSVRAALALVLLLRGTS